MKIISLYLFLFLFSANSYSCGFFTGLFTTENVSIDYVGKINFGEFKKTKSLTQIPITFTGGKWLQNSGIAFKKVIANVSNFEINITIQTCLASSGSQNKDQSIIVSKLLSGKYKVNYVNPDDSVVYIGEVKI
ncbi:hypothetical protein ACRRS0_09845 [Agarivorans sp. QJM3NY_29]|uniref:hypothetical protein n=1 Tax=unclassified Agarivorans TaxID=2636026 RepID=UPI003D7D324D